MNKVHDLKCDTEHFSHIWDNLKTFEVRANDREYEPGDILILRETGHPQGIRRTLIVKVIYFLQNFVGIQDGYIAMSIIIMNRLPDGENTENYLTVCIQSVLSMIGPKDFIYSTDRVKKFMQLLRAHGVIMCFPE